MQYKYNKSAGALQEAASLSKRGEAQAAYDDSNSNLTNIPANFAPRRMAMSATAQTIAPPPPPQKTSSVDPIRQHGGSGMFFYTVHDGHRVLMTYTDGNMEVVVGPKRIFRWRKRFRSMEHHVAHPGEFLIVRFRNGSQKHLTGPAHFWVDPRECLSVEKEDALQIADKEAIVVYSKDETGQVKRRITHGPAAFVPEPGEWLHTFSWHGSAGSAGDYQKIPNGLIFQKLYLLPDQMYHNVDEVRTTDDAVLTIKLMIFFELTDIEKMLATTHDPIGDFVNAASSDIVEFVGKHDFDGFKKNTEQLNDLAAYKQLNGRAQQCGYTINKVVYRGYGAPASLQQMHDQAIESRTRLRLEKETERQAQELEDFKLERNLSRASKQREEKARQVDQDLLLDKKRNAAQLESAEAERGFSRAQSQLDTEQAQILQRSRNELYQAHLEQLSKLGVELTNYLTQARADQVIELRGDSSGAHVHLADKTER